MPLADRATNIIDLLDIYEIGERPLIFITHSMGGLLVKQLLRHAYEYGNSSWKSINVGGADKPNSGNSLCDFFSQSPSFKNLSKFFL